MKSRSFIYAILLLTLFFLLTSTLLNTQGGSTFQTTWGGTGNDVGQAVTLDHSGNIYVTGYTSSFASGNHVFLIKYDPAGNLLWQRMWGGSKSEFGRGIGVDSNDNIYVTGYTSSFGNGGNDVFLLKWNSSGGLVWQRTWGGAGDDLGFGLTVNATDGVYVTGSSYTLGNPKVVLLKFDTSGNLLWQRAWGGSGGNYGQSVALDSAGGVYVTGYTSSTGVGGQDLFVLKYDSSGNLSWQHTLGGSQDDEGYSIAVDSSKNIYVVGATQSAGAGNDDALILKVTSSGNLVWQKTWGGVSTDQAQSITVDNLGFVYVTGWTSSFGGSPSHVFLLSLNFAGSLLWQTLWGGGGTDAGFGIAAAGSGYAVTTGFVSEAGPYSNSSVSGTYATSSLSTGTPNFSASSPNLGTQKTTGIASIPTGSTSYGGGQDSFLFKFGAPTVPTPPNNLVATGGQRYVNLSWSPPAFNGFNSINGYKIYRGTAAGTETLLATIGNQTRYTDFAVAGGVAYYYKVTAVNSIGESGPSNEALTNPVPTTPPTAPQGLTAVASTSQIQLTWSTPASTGGQSITGYNVYRGTTSGGETLLANLATQNTYTDSSVLGGTTYYYRVTAVNLVGESALSNEASGTPVSAPTPPQNLQAISTLGKIILSWSAPSSDGGLAITGYNIYRGNSSGSETLLASATNQLSYTDSQVVNRTYFYKVSAVNAIGVSGYSNEASAAPSAKPGAPTAPTGLSATAGKSNVTLTWTAPISNGGASIQGYNIYRSTVSGSEALLYPLVANLTSFTDTGVIVGTTYYYEVSAVNTVPAEGPQSNEANAKPFTAPSAPQNLQAITSLAKIYLTWTPPANNGAASITGYRIYRGNSTGTETFLTAIGNQTTYIDMAATNASQRYFYTVTGINAGGEGPHSTEASAMPSSSPTIPSAPQNVSASAGKQNVTLTWTPPISDGGSPITGYEILRGTLPGGETSLVNVTATQTNYVDLGRTGGTPYYYRIRAVNAVGPGTLSNEVSATPTSAPSPPPNLAATAGINKVKITWATPQSSGGLSIIGYKIYRGTTSGTETYLATVTGVDQLSYTDNSATYGKTYYYKVTAFNSVGESSLSNEASATPTPPPPPNTKPQPPTNVAATPGINNITLTWTPPSDNGGTPITNYQIWRGTSLGGETFLTLAGNVTSYVDTDASLSSSVTYYYYIKAVNSVGASNPSNEVSASPLVPSTPPNQPTNLRASITSSGLVNLTWELPAPSSSATPITGYNIYRATSPGGEGAVPYAVTSNVASYLDRSVTAGTTYYYRITAVNSVGESGYSNEVSITVPSPPGFPIIPVAIAALLIVAVGALGVIFWRRRVSQRLMMPP